MNVVDNKSLRALKKKTQFFETPNSIAENMINLCGLGRSSKILEPSAGRGKLLHQLKKEYNYSWFNEVQIDVCESYEPFIEELNSSYNFICNDFLDYNYKDSCKYDFIIMNPPYSRNQAVRHVRHAWNHLNPSGRIIALLPLSHQSETLYQEFLTECVNYQIQSQSFQETKIKTVIMTIDKPLY